MSEEIELLPLGTAVKIENDDSPYILISRIFQKHEEGLVPLYRGVPHPYGESKKYKTVVISNSSILEVLHRGYEDDLDKAYIEEQKDTAAEASFVPLQAQEVVQTVPIIAADLSHQTPTETDVSESVSQHPKDPFYNLRKRGK